LYVLEGGNIPAWYKDILQELLFLRFRSQLAREQVSGAIFAWICRNFSRDFKGLS
jgi:hypothetical protein